MSKSYDIHTTLLDADERALQTAHEMVGAIIQAGRAGNTVLDELREVRELIGNVLASTEESK